MKLSKWFTKEEIEFSEIAERVGFDNSLPQFLLDKAKRTCSKMDTVRDALKKAVFITSGYRCLRLNRILKSKDYSQHPRMEALDFVSPGFGSPAQVAVFIRDNADLYGIEFDQLILENTWVHISFVDEEEITHRKPRKEVLTLYRGQPPKTGLWTKDGREV